MNDFSSEPVRPAAAVLADFAANLAFDDLPPRVVDLARDCLIDAVACAIFGKDFAWSRMVLDEALASGSGGPCMVPGLPGHRFHLPQAALVLGTFAHSFELDSLRKPGAGVHPGATVALPALAAAQSAGASGRALLASIVAGCEVMFRIGAATMHTPEKRGFHAPGLTGPFGSAAACGKLLGLTSAQLANAFGIAGSLSGGLLAFARAGRGGMVKRLHLGRAAESGVLAARLAGRGYEGPDTVLEGEFGLLDTFCEATDPDQLTRGLGETWEIERLCLKSYACHVTAQAPIHALRERMDADGFTGGDIASIRLAVAPKVISHHAQRAPRDVMGAQYSVPYALAIAAVVDPVNPKVFSERSLQDPKVRDLAQRIELVEREGVAKGWGADLAIQLRDGRETAATAETFPGCPETPLSRSGLRAKFEALTIGLEPGRGKHLFDILFDIADTRNVAELHI
ncbi:MmgE/PrpD family protein [Chelativorans sp. AA-79]|uniref:MmgE/PrpD family protein n=1 Tax=Chelativorans sp. AA-79 TaxID=3028735 RepID=UPI0023F9372A|nr:MmgE/PrpD family protein [Chelativorans sp. AA-79]WEX10660.1 MmgE/PrpD family protein [Chelativorans sp. AA-79]